MQSRDWDWFTPAFMLSATAHAAALAVSFWTPGTLLLDESAQDLDRGSLILVSSTTHRADPPPESHPTLLLAARWQAPEQEPDAPPVVFAENPHATRGEKVPGLEDLKTPLSLADFRTGGTGARAQGKEGPIGNPLAPERDLAWGMEGPPDNQHRTTAHVSPLQEWPTWYSNELNHTWDGPKTPFPERYGAGRDPFGAEGKMYGADTGDPLGVGLGVVGAAKGGGGFARSIGTGWTGPMGHGAGSDDGQGIGISQLRSAGPFHRRSRPFAHTPRAPALHTHVAYEVIDRVARANATRLRACLDASGPREITLGFVVSTDGAVRDVSVGDTQGLRASEERCLIKAWAQLSFLPAGNQDSEGTYRVRL